MSVIFGLGDFGIVLAPKAANPNYQSPIMQQMLATTPRFAPTRFPPETLPSAQTYNSTAAGGVLIDGAMPEGTFVPQQVGFFDQYGALVIAGGAAVALLGVGYFLLNKPKVKTAGYRRRRRRR